MKKTSKVSRRSFVGLVTGAAASAVMASTAKAQSGLTDSDSGPNSDSPGYGRGNGVTDSDSGPNADRAGNGRGSRTTGLTDSDTGPNRDAAGNGRGGRTGLTDSDSSDAAGNGRGNRSTGITDSDSSDAAGNGRGGNQQCRCKWLWARHQQRLHRQRFLGRCRPWLFRHQ
jgi:hypothetical protein